MDLQQLTPFGRYLIKRLDELGKDKEWLIRKLRENGNSTSIEQLDAQISGAIQSKPREAAIGIVLHAEEARQRFRKIIGIKDE